MPEHFIQHLAGEPQKTGLAQPERKPLPKPQHDGLMRPEKTKEG